MKNSIITSILLVLPLFLYSQLINDGGSIHIESGALVIWKSSIENNSIGQNMGFLEIINDGILQIEGDLINNATIHMDPASALIFNGDGTSNITSGNAVFSNVELDKINNDLILHDMMHISKNLNFQHDNNKVILNNNSLVFQPNASISSADENEFIVADDLGKVIKEFGLNSTFIYHIGTSNGRYTPLSANVTSGNYPLFIDVNTESVKQPNVPLESTSFINRFWNVDLSNSSNFDATLTGTYHQLDLPPGSDFMEIKGAHYNNSDWSFNNSTNNGFDITTSINSSGDFTGINTFGKIDLKAFLQGAYLGGNLMSTNLNTSNLIPLTSPYDGITTVISIPNNITDWIEIEIRDETNPSIILSSQSAFLRNDGVVLGLDGNPNILIPNAPDQAYVGLNHRNHLSVNSPGALNLDFTNYDSHDFTTSLTQAYNNPAIVNNDAMINISQIYGEFLYGLLRGDANHNNSINVIDVAITSNGSVPIQSNVYLGIDLNLNSVVNVIDVAIARNASIPIKSAHIY